MYVFKVSTSNSLIKSVSACVELLKKSFISSNTSICKSDNAEFKLSKSPCNVSWILAACSAADPIPSNASDELSNFSVNVSIPSILLKIIDIAATTLGPTSSAPSTIGSKPSSFNFTTAFCRSSIFLTGNPICCASFELSLDNSSIIFLNAVPAIDPVIALSCNLPSNATVSSKLKPRLPATLPTYDIESDNLVIFKADDAVASAKTSLTCAASVACSPYAFIV